MAGIDKKNFDAADESAKPSGNITVDTIEVNGRKLQRVTAQPGWKWVEDLGPVFKAKSCPVDHLLYMLSGKMGVHMDSGEEIELGPGDSASITPGHTSWGIGSERTVWLELPH